MKTDDLIESLVADLAPVRPGKVPARFGLAAAVGGAFALVLVLAWLGVRPDLATAAQGMMFWMKAGYTALLGVAGFCCAERLARPAGSARSGMILGLAALAILAILGALELMAAPPAARAGVWLGGSWRRCPLNILALSVPTLVLALLVMRRLAPTRLTRAGAAAGFFAGGVAATVYGLHCNEFTLAFLATWYTLGIVLSTAAGALVGPWALRWR